MKLDVGSGHRKTKGFTGIDIIEFQDTDIQHDITIFPWPIDDGICTEIVMNYVWGCIEPKSRIKLMNELWRIITPNGSLTIKEQHSSTNATQFDPMYYSGANESTWAYFIHDHNRYEVYRPKPWGIVSAHISEKPTLTITVALRAIK